MGKANLRYFDFNNNVFELEKLKVSYDPIAKEASYSGKYDGGKPATGKLTQKQLDTINAKIETIKDSKSLKVKKRSGQCGMLIIYGEESKKKLLLPESTEQKKIESLLRAAVGLD